MAILRYPVGHAMNPRVACNPVNTVQIARRPCEPWPLRTGATPPLSTTQYSQKADQ